MVIIGCFDKIVRPVSIGPSLVDSDEVDADGQEERRAGEVGV